jgi:molybdopterin-containing oxidoreductase family iron-sulfur binding subunit
MGLDRRKFLALTGLTAISAISSKLTGQEIIDTTMNETTSVNTPMAGKRWGMVIDLKKCLAEKGCTKCMDACHKIHNVPDFGNPKDEIKWIWKEEFGHAFPSQHHEMIKEALKEAKVPVLCNHCDNPACVRVCPTKATFKRDDGIIMMDMHRCIGCRYCVAACPYGSRSFNWRDPRPFIDEVNDEYPTRTRGVVEKCNFCAERLARGMMPKCTEVCPVKALVFGDLEDADSEIRHILEANHTFRRKPTLGTQPEVYYIV